MAKRKEKMIFALLLAAPPWTGIMMAAAIWIFAQFIFDHLHLPGWQENRMTAAVDAAIHQPAIRQFSWLLIAICLGASAGSFFSRKRRAALLDQQRSIESIRNLTWQAFERLVAEAYERLAFTVTENGQHGPDGGVDLFLRKNGRTTIVQCKQWRSMSVGAPVVREMFGLMQHHSAEAVKIVCVGHFTSEAIAFARGKPIELVSGVELMQLVQAVQPARPLQPDGSASSAQAAQSVGTGGEQIVPAVHAALPSCPKCGGTMVTRTARQSKEQFLGCVAYPQCRGVRALS